MKIRSCLILASVSLGLSSCGDDLPPAQDVKPTTTSSSTAPPKVDDTKKPDPPKADPPPADPPKPADPVAQDPPPADPPKQEPPKQDPPKQDPPGDAAVTPSTPPMDKAQIELELAKLRELQYTVNQGTDEAKKQELVNKIRDLEHKLAQIKPVDTGEGFEVRADPNPDADRAMLDELVKKAPILNAPPK